MAIFYTSFVQYRHRNRLGRRRRWPTDRTTLLVEPRQFEGRLLHQLPPVRTSFGDLNGGARGAALQADGKVVAVGFQATATKKQAQFALARYLGDGTAAAPARSQGDTD